MSDNNDYYLPGTSPAEWAALCDVCRVGGFITVEFDTLVVVNTDESESTGYPLGTFVVRAIAYVMDREIGAPREIRHHHAPLRHECATDSCLVSMAQVLYEHECREQFSCGDERVFDPHAIGGRSPAQTAGFRR